MAASESNTVEWIGVRAVLLDSDGVLVDSAAAIRAAWATFAASHGFRLDEVIAATQGRRTVDTLRALLNKENVDDELGALEEVECSVSVGVDAVRGAADFVAALPEDRVAVATSGSRRVLEQRLRLAGVPIPGTIIAADDVSAGKPDPEPYARAAAALGVSGDQCVVFEDSSPGIEAARGIGAMVCGVMTYKDRGELSADYYIRDFREVECRVLDGTIELGFSV